MDYLSEYNYQCECGLCIREDELKLFKEHQKLSGHKDYRLRLVSEISNEIIMNLTSKSEP